jgi:hypothetical protein
MELSPFYTFRTELRQASHKKSNKVVTLLIL